jgi:hypothetical protein
LHIRCWPKPKNWDRYCIQHSKKVKGEGKEVEEVEEYKEKKRCVEVKECQGVGGERVKRLEDLCWRRKSKKA